MTFTESNVSRRKFFTKSLKIISGATAVFASIPLLGFFVSPALRGTEGNWIAIGDVALLKDNEPSKITYTFRRKDGWMTSEVRKTGFARKQAGDKIAVLNNKCTHLGCAVDWSSTEGHFTCPCHGGIFDADGNVISGPPPKPLAQMEAKIENNTIYVQEV